MKAVIRKRYGSPDVLQLAEVDQPTPGDNQVLVQVRAASVNKAEWYELTSPPLLRLISGGIRKPKRELLGADIAGRVEAVGAKVSRFKAGDEVFGCGRGGFAEYVCAREDLLVPKPANVSFEEAAAVPVAAITALQGLRKGGIQPGKKVLVDGASGGVGTFAVQIAKSFGAEVTAVCSARNLDLARSLGADRVIDYDQEDFTKSGQTYDLILGVNGHHSIWGYRRSLTPAGAYMMAGSSKLVSSLPQVMLLGPLLSRKDGRRLGFMGIAKLNQDDLAALKDLLESGKLKPFVDKTFHFSEAAEAFRYLGEGHARGKVVVTIGSAGQA